MRRLVRWWPLFTGEFARLVVPGCLVTVPLSYLALDRWLQEFALPRRTWSHPLRNRRRGRYRPGAGGGRVTGDEGGTGKPPQTCCGTSSERTAEVGDIWLIWAGASCVGIPGREGLLPVSEAGDGAASGTEGGLRGRQHSPPASSAGGASQNSSSQVRVPDLVRAAVLSHCRPLSCPLVDTSVSPATTAHDSAILPERPNCLSEKG